MPQYEFICPSCNAECVRILKMSEADAPQRCTNPVPLPATSAVIGCHIDIVCGTPLARVEIPSSVTITADKRWFVGAKMSDGSKIKGPAFGSDSRKWKGFGP